MTSLIEIGFDRISRSGEAAIVLLRLRGMFGHPVRGFAPRRSSPNLSTRLGEMRCPSCAVLPVCLVTRQPDAIFPLRRAGERRAEKRCPRESKSGDRHIS